MCSCERFISAYEQCAAIDLSHSRFDYTIVRLESFYKSYFLYDEQTGSRSSKSNGKDNEFEYNFLFT